MRKRVREREPVGPCGEKEIPKKENQKFKDVVYRSINEHIDRLSSGILGWRQVEDYSLVLLASPPADSGVGRTCVYSALVLSFSECAPYGKNTLI